MHTISKGKYKIILIDLVSGQLVMLMACHVVDDGRSHNMHIDSLHNNDSIVGGGLKVNVINARPSSTNQLQACPSSNHLGRHFGS